VKNLFRAPLPKHLASLVYASPEFALLFFRQADDVPAFFGTTVIVFFRAFAALNEEQVATVVPAICMVITRRSALMAHTDNVFRNALAKAFVEHKILPDEFVLKSLLINLPGILYYPAVQLVYIAEPAVPYPCACLLTTYASGAVHEYRFVAMIGQQVFYNLQFLAERVNIGKYGISEVTHFAFIVVAHIHDDGIGIIGKVVERARINMRAGLCYVERLIVQTVCHNFFPDKYL
jgi:hypothetical protein